jgi:hypothetical protein
MLPRRLQKAYRHNKIDGLNQEYNYVIPTPLFPVEPIDGLFSFGHKYELKKIINRYLDRWN